MDAFLLARLAAELQRRWSGAWLQGVWEDRLGRLIFKLRRRGTNALLMLSARRDDGGLGLVARRPSCPPRPPALAAYLRAHGHGVLLSARCVPYERVVQLSLGNREAPISVVLELLPHRGRLLALDPKGIVRAVAADERPGPVMGVPYVPPVQPADCVLPDQVTSTQVEQWLGDGVPLEQQVFGIGPELAREIAHRAGFLGAWPAWRSVVETYGGDGPIWVCGGQLAATELSHRGEQGCLHPEGLVLAGERFFPGAEDRPVVLEEAEQRHRELRFRKKLERRIRKIRGDLDTLPEPGAARRAVDAFAAALATVPPGAETVEVPDLHQPERTHRVVLEPRLSPGANLNRLYERVRKLERTWVALRRRLEESEVELGAGPPALATVQRPFRGPAGGAYHKYRSSDGWTIRVGRNGAENDRLVRESKPWDLWLHVRDAAGGHVVVRKPGREAQVPDRTLAEAAGLAALHSRLRDERLVEVRIAEISRLRKPKGASPGQVVVAGDRTLRIPPGAGNPRPVESCPRCR